MGAAGDGRDKERRRGDSVEKAIVSVLADVGLKLEFSIRAPHTTVRDGDRMWGIWICEVGNRPGCRFRLYLSTCTRA